MRLEARTAWADGDYTRALTAFAAARDAGGVAASAWTWIGLAQTQAKLGDRTAALSSARTATTRVRDSASALLRLAELFTSVGSSDEAVAVLDRLDTTGPHDTQVTLRAARVLLRNGRWPAVLEKTEILLLGRLSGNAREDTVVLRATALARLGREDDAKVLLGHLEDDSPQAGGRAAGRTFLELGAPVKAWERFAALAPPSLRPENIESCAGALFRAGYLTEAQDAVTLAIRIAPGRQTPRDLQARIIGEERTLRGEWQTTSLKPGAMAALPGRILHMVGKTLPYVQAGYTLRTQYIVDAQRRHGVEPHVMSKLGFPLTEGVSVAPIYELVDGIPHHRLTEGGPPHQATDRRLDRNAVEAVDVVRALRPSVVHAASDYENALIAIEIGRAFGIPVVYEVRGFWEETWLSSREASAIETEYYQLRRARETACMQAVDHVVTLSQVMADEIAARGVDAERITVVPNAVDPDSFPPLPRDHKLARSHGITDEDVVIGYVSSFSSYEGIPYLVEAVAELRTRGRRVKCLLVGDGKDRPTIESRVRAFDLGDDVILTGRVPHSDVLRYYGMIDIFVVPRTDDRVCHLVTPLKPFEAMATARATVVSKTRALSELVRHRETGMLFTPEDSMDLADVLDELVLDTDLRQKLGTAARAWVCEHRTWERNGSRYLALYRSLVSG